MDHWRRAENRGDESKGGESDELGVLHKERVVSLETGGFSAWEAQGFGKYPQWDGGQRGAAVKEDTGGAANLGEGGWLQETI